MSGAINAQSYVGGIAAVNLDDGSIANCLVTAPIHYSKEVDQAGAVVGQNSGTISGVVYDSQITMFDNLAPSTGVAGKLTREIVAGTPTITDCFNAGTVKGANCIGGILGRVPTNVGAAVVTRCLNTGWLEGNADNAANIGSISGFYNTQSTYTECVYDTCMSNIKYCTC